jgi:hypothetical protein
MVRRYYAAILASRASSIRGFGRPSEAASYRYASRSGPRKLFIWYFESLNGPKGVYALRKKVGDPSRFFAGRPSELSNITRGSKRGAGDKPRGSTAKRGAKRRSLASHGAIKSRQFQVGKGLTRREALAIAVRRSRRDHRGFSYNPKTGVAVLT